MPTLNYSRKLLKQHVGRASSSDVINGLQVLPLVPPEDVFWSPYSGLDALCGNTLMISLDELVKDGLLERTDLPEEVPVTTADFFKVHSASLALQNCTHAAS